MVFEQKTIKYLAEAFLSKGKDDRAFSAGLEFLSRDIEKAIAKAKDEAIHQSRSGWVGDTKFGCCPEVLPWVLAVWFSRFVDPDAGMHGMLQLKWRDKPVNFCPFCGAKL